MRHIGVVAVLVVSCAGEADWEPEEVSSPAIMSNAIMSNAIMSNALTANRLASDKLIRLPLRDETFWDPYLAAQLNDPDARQVLAYLYSCVAGTSDFLKVSGSFGTEIYQGSLGICPAWTTGAPSRACQEQASACLLARVNAYGHRVEMSFRGEPAAIFTGASQVLATDTYLGGFPSDRVVSLLACGSPGANPPPDCGWSVDRVGTCRPNTAVTISTYDLGGWASGATELRALEGVHADDAVRALLVTHTPLNGRDKITFPCPGSGHFSVMKAPAVRGAPVTIKTGGSVSEGKFPAPEGWQVADKAVFTWAEGAFFGNIFGSANFDKKFLDNYCDPKTGECFHPVQPPNLTVFRAYACTSDVWVDWKAYLKERICAGVQQNCAAKSLGRCSNICALSDGLQRTGDGDYQQCKAPDGTVYTTGITTYLDDPCAVNQVSCGVI